MGQSFAETPRDIIVTVSPWSSCMTLNSLHITEKLGGDIAGGTMTFRVKTADEDTLKSAIESNSGIINISRTNGTILYEIPFSVISRTYLGTEFTCEFLCIPDMCFLDRLGNTTFDNIKDAVLSLYPGTEEYKSVRIEPSPSVANLKIQQFQETDYGLCKRLLMSYKRDVAFGGGFSGMMIKDLCGEFNSRGENERPSKDGALNTILVDSSSFVSVVPIQMDSDKLLRFDSVLPLEELEKKPKNCSTAAFFTTYGIFRGGYESLAENYYHNKRNLEGNLYSSFKTTGFDVPDYRLGDVVSYVNTDMSVGLKVNLTTFICYSNELFYSITGSGHRDGHGAKFSWSSLFLGLETGPWME